MSDIIALQTKLRSQFAYPEFDTDFGAKAASVQAKASLPLSEVFARLQAQRPLAA